MGKVDEKRNAGRAAAAHVRSGMTIGLGTGSTAFFAIEAIGEAWQAGHLTNIRAIATSEATAEQAASYGIPLVELVEVDRINLTIDGADEFDEQKRLVKGGGGALFREKLVAFLSDEMIVISDASKQVETLGAFPLPIEVFPKAVRLVERELKKLDLNPQLRTSNEQTYVTDNGNYIFDCHIEAIQQPEELDMKLHQIPGVIETGLFLGLATQIIMGKDEEVIKID